MQEPFSPPAEFLQVIADAQATADFLLYGALAVAVFLAVLLPRRHPSHKRKIYLASVLVAFLGYISDSWVYPPAFDKACEYTGVYENNKLLPKDEGYRRYKEARAVDNRVKQSFEEHYEWHGNFLWQMYGKDYKSQIPPRIKIAYYGPRWSNHLLSPLEGFVSRTASQQCS